MATPYPSGSQWGLHCPWIFAACWFSTRIYLALFYLLFLPFPLPPLLFVFFFCHTSRFFCFFPSVCVGLHYQLPAKCQRWRIISTHVPTKQCRWLVFSQRWPGDWWVRCQCLSSTVQLDDIWGPGILLVMPKIFSFFDLLVDWICLFVWVFLFMYTLSFFVMWNQPRCICTVPGQWRYDEQSRWTLRFAQQPLHGVEQHVWEFRPSMVESTRCPYGRRIGWWWRRLRRNWHVYLNGQGFSHGSPLECIPLKCGFCNLRFSSASHNCGRDNYFLFHFNLVLDLQAQNLGGVSQTQLSGAEYFQKCYSSSVNWYNAPNSCLKIWNFSATSLPSNSGVKPFQPMVVRVLCCVPIHVMMPVCVCVIFLHSCAHTGH